MSSARHAAPPGGPADPRPGRGLASLDGLAGPAGLQIRATFRVLAAAVIGVVLLLGNDPDPGPAGTFVPLGAGLYVLASTVLAWPRGAGRPDPRLRERTDTVRAGLDIVALCSVALAVDGPRMVVLMFLCAVPLGYGLTLPASAVLTLTALGIAGALLLWGIAPGVGAAPLSEGSLLLLAFALAWCGLIACLIAVERERRAQRIRQLSGSVRDVLRQAMRAESTERTKVADLLHDDVLQLLLSTRHDINDAMDGDLDLLPEAKAGIEAAIRRLRETVATLRDEQAADQGLGQALRAAGADATAGRGVAIELDVEPGLEDAPHPIVLSAVRDLLRDAEASSAARSIAVSVRRDGDAVRVELRHHDPRHALGLAPSDDSSALVRDVTARVTAVDGSIEVAHDEAAERRVVVRVPEGEDRADPASFTSPPPAVPLRRSLRARSSSDQPTQRLG